MDPRKEVEKIRKQVDELEASLSTTELDEAIETVVRESPFVKLKSQDCDEVVFVNDRTGGTITIFGKGIRPLFDGRFYLGTEALSAIVKLDEVFKQTRDC